MKQEMAAAGNLQLCPRLCVCVLSLRLHLKFVKVFTMQVSLYFTKPLGCYSNIAGATAQHMKVPHSPEKFSFVLVNTLEDFLTQILQNIYIQQSFSVADRGCVFCPAVTAWDAHLVPPGWTLLSPSQGFSESLFLWETLLRPCVQNYIALL